MRRHLNLFVAVLAVVSSVALGAQTPAENPNTVYSPALYGAMKYRLIGPHRGGRVTAVAGVPDEPHTYYMGATGGGVWKTTDGGAAWHNISDAFFKVGSIGAIAAAESDPNVVYVGTGSACPRGNVSIGDGVWKSTDAGKTWKHVGLPKAGQIARIAVHPADPDRVYAAVLGNVFGPGPDRGVYRSRDGGQNWERVLFASDTTGAVDLVMNPGNPRILYACMWRAERKPWTLIDGSDDGGVFKSADGGDTWERLKGGLPEGLVGRSGVAVSPANPERVWVIIESGKEEEGGLYRSEDAGKTWTKISGEHKLRGRAWYYNHVFAGPQDENTVYVLNAPFYKSIDGGKTFEQVRVPHGDNHALWINPRDPRIMINGNDGGANVSYNGGRTWSTQLNQPTAEFYRVTVDSRFPYRVYGAQQDNTTISVPSRPPGGITPQEHWYDVGGGESGHIAVDPRNPDVIYAGNYIGQITRLDRAAGHMRQVNAYPELHDGLAPRDIRYRFQWNAPIRISPHDPKVLYHASQFVHKSTDEGQTWQVISPDLTTDNDRYQDIPGGPIQHDHTGVELFTTIFAFEESPHQAGFLWAGSDDGLVHLTRNGGKDWNNITPGNMPKDATVNMIELSAHGPGRAFLAVYNYRLNDFRPYIYRTDDFGSSWELLTDGRNGIPEDHFVRVVREDPDRKGLLYAGTEFGMFVSFDDGRHWQPFQLNLPVTPITDLAVHRQDLVVATQGRSFWILDDLTPLHQISDAVAAAQAHLYAPRKAYRMQEGGFREPDAPERPPRGVLIYFFLAEKPEKEVVLQVLDSKNNPIRTFSTKPEEENKIGKLELSAGMNRFVWDLAYPPADTIRGIQLGLSRTDGPQAPPGAYQVKLTVEEWTQTRSFRVDKDPRWQAADEDLRAQFELAVAVRDKLNEVHAAVRKVRSVREQAKAVAGNAVRAGADSKVRDGADALARKLTEIEEALTQPKSVSSQDTVNYTPRLDNQFSYLYTVVSGQDARPTQGCYQLFEDLKTKLAPIQDRLREVMASDLKDFLTQLQKAGFDSPIVVR